jgi:hypothetical protein
MKVVRVLVAIIFFIFAIVIGWALGGYDPPTLLLRSSYRATPVTFIATPTPLSFVPIPEPTKPYYINAYSYGYLSPCGVYKPTIPGKEASAVGAMYDMINPNCPRR